MCFDQSSMDAGVTKACVVVENTVEESADLDDFKKKFDENITKW